MGDEFHVTPQPTIPESESGAGPDREWIGWVVGMLVIPLTSLLTVLAIFRDDIKELGPILAAFAPVVLLLDTAVALMLEVVLRSSHQPDIAKGLHRSGIVLGVLAVVAFGGCLLALATAL